MLPVLSAVQVLGVLAVLVGVVLVLPLGLALIVNGGLVVGAATAVETLLLKRPAAPSDRRDGSNVTGVE